MMGERQSDQAELFYGFGLERHVPADHLLRSIDRFVDLGDIREQLRPFYSDIGRPSIDPELMIRMLIIRYCMGFARRGGCATRFLLAATAQNLKKVAKLIPMPQPAIA